MKYFTTKHKLVLCSISLLSIVACGGELPIQEMDIAKSEIARAESLQAAEYAPAEIEEARKALFHSHEKASEEKASDAKKAADYAISKAYDALEKTLPKLSARARDLATEAIDQADAVYATGLATAQFDRAISLRKEGDLSMEQGDQALGEFLEEKNEAKKGDLRQVSFAHYEASYNRYEESKDSAIQAREIALASKSELKQSARYVEEDLNTAETYLGGPNDSTRKERDSLATAYQDIDNNELKKANEIIQNSRANARTLLAASIQNYARERNLTATEVVEDANSRFEDIKETDVQKPESLKMSYESARENLGAANESLASAGNLYSQEKFEDSIRQSEEAIRLGEIVIEESATLTPDAIAKRGGVTPPSNLSDSTISSKSSPLKEGWSKYTVKSAKPEDCLWRIAQKKEFYGNAKLWPRIYEANKGKIKNKNLIYPNQVLYIPPKSGEITSPFQETPVNAELSPTLEQNLETSSPASSEINSGKPVNGPDEELDEPVDSGVDDEILQEEDFDEEK